MSKNELQELLQKEIETYGSYERAMIDPAVNSWISLDNDDNEYISDQDIIYLKEHLAELLKRECAEVATTSNKALLQKVREIIGEDENEPGYWSEGIYRNHFRKELRTKLDELEKEK